MNLEARLNALAALGRRLQEKDEYLEALMHRAWRHNQWFTVENQRQAVTAIAQHFLDEEKLRRWTAGYQIAEAGKPLSVALVMAGNIPLVGFHDLLCVFSAGHKAMIKLSDKDPYLLPYILKLLQEIDPHSSAYFEIVERLGDFDAVIATGSNNSARYFEAYFGKYPHIIRRNRNAKAVLTGEESREELSALGEDVFQYFGLGCRNVSKVYVPKDYDFEPLLEALHEFREIVLHEKYKHNFDYNFAMHVLNKTSFKNNGCLILSENRSIQSRIAELHFEYYNNLEKLAGEIEARREEIQCVVGRKGLFEFPTVDFGATQKPELWDYADGEDTMAFLTGLY